MFGKISRYHQELLDGSDLGPDRVRVAMVVLLEHLVACYGARRVDEGRAEATGLEVGEWELVIPMLKEEDGEMFTRRVSELIDMIGGLGWMLEEMATKDALEGWDVDKHGTPNEGLVRLCTWPTMANGTVFSHPNSYHLCLGFEDSEKDRKRFAKNLRENMDILTDPLGINDDGYFRLTPRVAHRINETFRSQAVIATGVRDDKTPILGVWRGFDLSELSEVRVATGSWDMAAALLDSGVKDVVLVAGPMLYDGPTEMPVPTT